MNEKESKTAEMKIPTTLKHKPVFVIDDYEKVDGLYAGNTDAKGISLGLAQWNERGRMDISAKIWRYTGEKWSRQSEEMPLHRVLDTALLIVAAKKHFHDAYRYPKYYNEDNTVIERIPMQGRGMTAQVCTDNPMIDTDMALFADAIAKNDEIISERLHRLADMLRDAGYGSQTSDKKKK